MHQDFAIIINHHRFFGYIFSPYLLEKDEKKFYLIKTKLTENNLNHYSKILTGHQIKIVNIIEEYNERNLKSVFTNKNISIREFIQNLKPEFISNHIRPFIERKIVNCIDLLQESETKLYLSEGSSAIYPENEVETQKYAAETVFNFIKSDNESKYFLSLKPVQKTSLSKLEKNLELTNKEAIILSDSPCILLLEKKLYFFKEKIEGKKFQVFFTKKFITVPKSAEEKFYKTFAAKCIANFSVEANGFQIIEKLPNKKAILSLEKDFSNNSSYVLHFQYDERKFPANKKQAIFVDFEKINDGFVFYKTIRSKKWEQECIDKLLKIGLIQKNDIYFYLSEINNLPPKEQTCEFVNWTNFNASYFEKEGFEIDQTYQNENYFTEEINLEFKVSDKNDWFDIMAVVNFGGKFKIPFLKLRKNILNENRHYVLPDGTIAILPDVWFSKYKDLLLFGEKNNKNIRLKKHHFNILSNSQVKTKRQSLQKLLKFDQNNLNNIKPPKNLKAKLRPYQLLGFRWMYVLKENSFGGCLADDMGLGKTVQTLTLLLKSIEENEKLDINNKQTENVQLDLFSIPEKENKKNLKNPSLIIMPVSLIHNWENEIRKFAPSMKTYKFIGGKRTKFFKEFYNYDVIFSTYGIIRNEFENIKNFKFHYLVLDESQMIKNPESKTAVAINELQSQYKLVLTGTPVENSLNDLWSQMNFLNKGLLGELNFFKKNIAKPIEKHNDKILSEKLLKMISPFILRRNKTEVEKDLPLLTEETLYCEMTEEQKLIYESEKSKIRNRIFKIVEEHGIKKSTLMVLQGLLKLRQIANHPVLSNSEYQFDSGKFEEILRNINNIISEGHKVLMFSSFVKHLELFVDNFKKNKLKFSILTGKSKDREKIIKEFINDPDNQIFLISIKAGGVGLNLTAADYVFLLDPWWNPAVENQAISRAHRIGQNNKVFAYKYISKNTIEEKILKLQNRKTNLAKTFINTDQSLKNLNVKDIEELFE
ncbi:MAG: DEAD/DEAH box helicase [Bacteroidales bacterium]|nr:DEAD/DEAH box helicase [Bacteroidales bacterium]